MGGCTSCLRMSSEEEKKKEEDNRQKPNQYEEIDDNFTILPNKKNTSNKEDTTTTKSKDDDLQDVKVTTDSVTYENVSNHSNNNLRNYVPSMAKTSDQDRVSEIPNVLYASVSNDVNGSPYENCDMTSKHPPQSSSGEMRKGSEPSANQNPEMSVPAPKTKDDGEMKGGKNKSSKKKTKSQAAPPPKPKKKLFKPKDSKADATKEPNNKDNQLTYIEVEFTTPPQSNRPAPSEPSTTYTDVVHEGGRLVLIR